MLTRKNRMKQQARKETFSERVKKEITSLDFSTHCMKSLLSSFLDNNLSIVLTSKGESWQITSPFQFIQDFIANIFEQLYLVNITKLQSEINKINGLRTYLLIVEGNFEQMQNDLLLNQKNKELLLLEQCCRRAYVTGAFLSAGSISSLEKTGYHLELRSYHLQYLRSIQNLLLEFKISSTIHKRGNQYFLYVKKSEQISDFLRLVSVFETFSEFEDIRIERDFNVQITRFNNLDISNLNKSTQSGVKQVEQINEMKAKQIYEKQSDKFKKFCELRLKNPTASLKEISVLFKEKYKINITRTGLNHFVIKLNDLWSNMKRYN